MFVALRDLKHARGRFILMSMVIVLITVLVTFLASLTAGLARESTSAVTDLPADHLAFSMPTPGDPPEFIASRVDADQWEGWADVDGVVSADPLGVATTRAETPGATVSVTALGVAAGSHVAPVREDGTPGDVDPGTIVLTRAAADALDAHVGDAVTLGGTRLTVAATLDTDQSFSHTPVVWMTLDDWQSIGARGAARAPGAAVSATVVALTTSGTADLAGADAALGTTTLTTSDARSAVSSFTAENLSLTTMQAFLLVISALVAGAFFTVWTISRSGDLAVLKALGATTRYLLRDALGQAAVLLGGGVTIGALLSAAAAAALSGVVPIAVTPTTSLVPAVSLILLGLTGAGVAIARIARIDPHAALAAR